ncbi:4295_t:CDS:1, partial [Scutellospora calospora]
MSRSTCPPHQSSDLSSNISILNLIDRNYGNEQLQSNINNILAQMIRTSDQTSNDTSTIEPSSSSMPVEYTTSLQQPQKPANSANNSLTNKEKETKQPTGKYSLTPVLNDLIKKASKVTLQGQNTTITSANPHLFKLTSQKYLSFDYTNFK